MAAPNFTAEHARELRNHLHDAALKCTERCLYQSAKWIAELLDSLPSHETLTPGSDTDPDSPMQDAPAPSNPLLGAPNADPQEAALETKEAHKYLLAQSYFNCREYDRCAAVFLPPAVPAGPGISSVSPKLRTRTPLTPQKGRGKQPNYTRNAISRNPYPKLSQKSLFLALYAKYMAGEKRKEEESEMVLGPADGGATVNRELADLARGLEGWFAERREKGLEGHGQGWLEYLYGVVLAKGKNEEEAKNWLVRSVHLYPFHWGAWHELNDILNNLEDLHRIQAQLPQNIMTLLFLLHANQELYQYTTETFSSLSDLELIFPTSVFLLTQRALLHYHAKDFEEASSLFATLITTHPHRLDALDHYSNILYVMGQRPLLSFLAQLATATDKFRPETCCVVGNYYSLKSEHEKAVMYFRRALTLDRNFLSAWTLMGHEYIEMKNTHAAIESYRRAVDCNRKDYRAWYGLGQAYEVLDMSFYALFYYQRASALRPFDPKMWAAVGSCYAKMGRMGDGIKALKRALVVGTYYDGIGSQQSSFNQGAGASFGSSTGARSGKDGGGGTGGVRKILDPETLYQIASMYEKLGEEEEAAAYMELTLQQETGASQSRLPDHLGSDADDGAAAEGSTTDGEGGGGTARGGDEDEDGGDGAGFGTGVTATTSKARLWLARWELRRGRLERADQLAAELCQDGVEVEEAKALMRDVRGRREGG